MSEGLWKTKYAAVNSREYFAEGVQSWFNNNRPPDHDHNHVDTRKELIEYEYPGFESMMRSSSMDQTATEYRSKAFDALANSYFKADPIYSGWGAATFF